VTCGLCTSNPSRWALRRDSILRLSTPRLSRSSLSQPSTAYQNKNDTTTSVLIHPSTTPLSPILVPSSPSSPAQSSPVVQSSPVHSTSQSLHDTSLPLRFASHLHLVVSVSVSVSVSVYQCPSLVLFMYVSDVGLVCLFVRLSGCWFALL
jgi:hypothetical protein